MVVALASATIGEAELNNIVSSRLLDPIQRIPGVGGANQFGSEFAMRIWLNPEKLQGYGLSASEVLAAVRGQNVQFAAGSFGAAPATQGQALTASVSAESRFSDRRSSSADHPAQLARRRDRAAGDVARVEIGAQTYARIVAPERQARCRFRAPARCLAPMRSQVAEAVRARMDELATSFPPG